MHFIHLRADFPNHSSWIDWAKYTDEGWYGSAAVRHYQLGHWNVPGDFNPAAALPVWPLLEVLLFRFTGVSLTAARALSVTIFGLTLAACYLLLRRWSQSRMERSTLHTFPNMPSLAPAIAILLLSASPFYFAFSRLAILEPLMLLLALASLVIAECAAKAGAAAWPISRAPLPPPARARAIARVIAWSALLGLSWSAMVLTKTTGIFFLPGITWMLWHASAHRIRLFFAAMSIAAAAASLSWGSYMLCIVRPHYLADYRYLFSANTYTGITGKTFWPVLADTFLSASCLGTAFSLLGILAVVAAAVTLAMRGLRNNSLVVSLLLWVFSYFAFLAWHDNLQARYYYALGVPLAMLIAMALDTFLLWGSSPDVSVHSTAEYSTIPRRAPRVALFGAYVTAAVVAIVTALGAVQQARHITSPEYTFVAAVRQLHEAIEHQRGADLAANLPVHPETILSISSADISFLTGLPSICDDFGTMTLPTRIDVYKPGWFVAWNDVEDDKMEALAPMYRLVRVGQWPAFDDPDRNLLILYRLDPLQQPASFQGHRRRGLNIPRRLQKQIAPSPPLKR